MNTSARRRPALDHIGIAGKYHFAADRRQWVLLAAMIGAQRSVHIVEIHDAGFDLIVVPLITTQLFGTRLLPSVTRLGLRGKTIFLTRRGYVGVLLLTLRVRTC
jgi:hypothetical protein